MTAPSPHREAPDPLAPRILFVDDDPRLLDGIRRRLRGRFAIETAVGPECGLAMVTAHPDYAVVVADMNMPGMDGARFLERVREQSPDTVRMMLTGNADLDTAMAAVNAGNVFRFMTKPVASEDLERFLTAGLEQRQLLAARHRAAAAEQANKTKSDFLATVSHELRTPLTVIRSNAEILGQFADDEPAAVRAEFLATIDSQARRLEAMIDQLLQTAELDAQELAPPPARPFDLAAVLRCAVGSAGDRTPTLTTEPASLPCRGDAAGVERAFEQLLANACRFSPPGAPIRVEASADGSMARVDVVDRGPGIAAAIADRVFEPFVQCADVSTDKPPGLGLGLTIAQRIVRRHGGTISFSDEPGGGTRFSVTLPLDQAPAVSA